MGEESNKGEKGKEEENKNEEEVAQQEIVLRVDMHCEACAKKISRSLRRFQGVEGVKADCKASKVVVKAAKGVVLDPLQLQDRVQKKSGRKVDIISPIPVENPKDETTPESKPTPAEEPPKKEEAPPPPPPPPPVTTLVLQVGMHCEACALALQRRIRKIKGVESVETDAANDRVTVKGVIDSPDQLVQLIYKRTKKHASIVKEEEKPKPAEEKGEEKSAEDKAEDGGNKEGGPEDGEMSPLAKLEHRPSVANMEYYYSNYAPQLFSDENPNACTIM